MLSRSLRKGSVDILVHELLTQRTVAPWGERGAALYDALSERFEVTPPRLEFRIPRSKSYEGLYEFRAKPPAVWVVEEGTNAAILVHEFAHHLQWQSGPGGALLHKDSLGRWLWHKPSVFVPLIDGVAKAALSTTGGWAI